MGNETSALHMPKYSSRLLGLLLIAAASGAHATHHVLYECSDASGNKQFTNIPANPKACRVLHVSAGMRDTAPVPAAAPARASTRASATPTPANFPRVDAHTQNQRDSDRRRILSHELGNEQKLLTHARNELAQQEAVRDGTERNYQRVLDRLEPFKRKVKLHEDNVASLQREMGNTR
jgi:hypothetical protein